jgi:hypothetical protein
VLLVALSIGKLAFYGAEWTIKKAASPVAAQDVKRPALKQLPAVTIREKALAH